MLRAEYRALCFAPAKPPVAAGYLWALFCLERAASCQSFQVEFATRVGVLREARLIISVV